MGIHRFGTTRSPGLAGGALVVAAAALAGCVVHAPSHVRFRGVEMMTEVHTPAREAQRDPFGTIAFDPANPDTPSENVTPIAQRLFEPDLRVCVRPEDRTAQPQSARYEERSGDADGHPAMWAVADDRATRFQGCTSSSQAGITAVGFGIEVDPWPAVRLRVRQGARVNGVNGPPEKEYFLPVLSAPHAEGDEQTGIGPFEHDPRPMREVRNELRSIASARYDLARLRHQDGIADELLQNRAVIFDVATHDRPRDGGKTSVVHRIFVPESLLPTAREYLGPTADGDGRYFEVDVIFYGIRAPEEHRESEPLTLTLVRDAVLDVGVIGDSIAWGQGVREASKWYTLVAQTLTEATGVSSRIHRFARSGATKVADVSNRVPHLITTPASGWGPNGNTAGETPLQTPTIQAQAERLLNGARVPDLDVVLVTGCFNDFPDKVMLLLAHAINGKNNRTLIRKKCDEEMREVLRTLVDTAEHGVVLGYPDLLSGESDVGPLVEPTANKFAGPVGSAVSVALCTIKPALCPLGPAVGGVAAIGTRYLIIALASWQLKDNAEEIGELIRDNLRVAVNNAGAEKFVFADLSEVFGDRNAALAPESWWWDPLFDPTDVSTVDPAGLQDDLRWFRARQCELDATGDDLNICKAASFMHPNAAGNRAMATAALRALTTGRVTSLRYFGPEGSTTLQQSALERARAICPQQEQPARAVGECYWDDSGAYKCSHRRIERRLLTRQSCPAPTSSQWLNCQGASEEDRHLCRGGDPLGRPADFDDPGAPPSFDTSVGSVAPPSYRPEFINEGDPRNRVAW